MGYITYSLPPSYDKKIITMLAGAPDDVLDGCIEHPTQPTLHPHLQPHHPHSHTLKTDTFTRI